MDTKTYLRGLIEIDPTELPHGQAVRGFWKGFLDFIRNLVVVAFLKFVADKTKSVAVIVLFELSTFALVGYLLAFGAVSFNFFAPLKNEKLRDQLNHYSYYLVLFLMYVLLRSVIGYVVSEIAKAQMLR